MNLSIQSARRRGFTLIEIMAAMSILMVIVLVLGNIFTDSTRIWKQGTKRAYDLGEGRAVMDFLVRELSQSFADKTVSFKLESENPWYGVLSYGWQSDELFFVSAVRTPLYGSDMRRAAPHHIYFVTNMWDEANIPIANRFTLVRSRKTGDLTRDKEGLLQSTYHNKEWWKYFTPIIPPYHYPENVGNEMEAVGENVAAFEVWAFSEDDGRYVYSYASTNHGDKLPLWIDMYLEMFSEEESIQMADLWNLADKTAAYAYRDKHSRRYAARVYFPNRLGYSR
ncbi:MAG TPA: prepilin-type N-terminal cleavage/methylation domain-containing protein [Kiritimatiellia bacterium]|nr:prepilin-type N-terminal cleavage/methylation domain-containing protein [Kiritimatiellia bacterium]HSA18442.1 prepilin-type N-terminal cleavage/methylation domain-containing protein [Kiritimatiellia bacterium]